MYFGLYQTPRRHDRFDAELFETIRVDAVTFLQQLRRERGRHRRAAGVAGTDEQDVGSHLPRDDPRVEGERFVEGSDEVGAGGDQLVVDGDDVRPGLQQVLRDGFE